jgi:hypothetical protein
VLAELPDHLAEAVAAAVEADRLLLCDDGLAVWTRLHNRIVA